MPIAPTFPWALRTAAAKCDILALHAPFPLNDIGLSLGVPDDVAVISHWHAEIIGRSAIMPAVAPFIRRTLRRADRIVVSDPSIIDRSPLVAEHAAKCVVIPFGVDIDYWAALDDRQRREVAALRTRHPRLIVSTGRLVPYKGYPVLLEAMKSVDGELIIIGDGADRERLQDLAKANGVADRVTFKGFLSRDEIKLHFHAAKVFALASISSAEAFGIVQIEAMACGVPVVNTRLPTAVPNIARHGIEGLTVTPGDAGQLADALNQLLCDMAKAAAMGAAARKRCEAEYSRAVFLSRVRKVYMEALDKRRR
jgi:rhamnosyl/mannosyltransferase